MGEQRLHQLLEFQCHTVLRETFGLRLPEFYRPFQVVFRGQDEYGVRVPVYHRVSFLLQTVDDPGYVLSGECCNGSPYAFVGETIEVGCENTVEGVHDYLHRCLEPVQVAVFRRILRRLHIPLYGIPLGHQSRQNGGQQSSLLLRGGISGP